MTLHSDSVITFAFLLSIFSLICAVPIYAQIRKNSPDFAWSQHGKVNTTPFNEVDLLGIALFVFIFGSIIYLSQHAPKMEPDGVTPHSVSLTPPIMVAGMIIQQVVLVFIVFVLLVFRGTNFVELWGLRWKNARYLVVIAPVGAIIAIAFTAGLDLFGYNNWLKETFGDDSKIQQIVTIYKGSTATYRILIAIAVVILAPLVEEVVFRGYIYAASKRFTNRFFAAFFSALFFAVIHNNINALLPLFFLALLLTLSYELTGSLWAPISIHALFNATTLINLEFSSLPGT